MKKTICMTHGKEFVFDPDSLKWVCPIEGPDAKNAKPFTSWRKSATIIGALVGRRDASKARIGTVYCVNDGLGGVYVWAEVDTKGKAVCSIISKEGMSVGEVVRTFRAHTRRLPEGERYSDTQCDFTMGQLMEAFIDMAAK